MKKKFLVGLASLFLSLSLFVAPALVSAQTGGSNTQFGTQFGQNTGLGDQDPRETIESLIQIGLTFLGVIAFLIVLYGGVLWMTAAGNDDKVGEAKKVLYSGVIGILIILSAYGLSTFVIEQLSQATGAGR